MLGALPMTAVEELACRMQSRRFPAGAAIVTLGEVGDLFYVLASGRAEVTMPDNDTHTLGPGDSFGEIALLRDVRRTATVTALEDVETLALDRAVFIAAVSGDRPKCRRAGSKQWFQTMSRSPVLGMRLTWAGASEPTTSMGRAAAHASPPSDDSLRHRRPSCVRMTISSEPSRRSTIAGSMAPRLGSVISVRPRRQVSPSSSEYQHRAR